MTTIAFDGEILAADSRCTTSGIGYQVRKLCTLNRDPKFGVRVMASAGLMAHHIAVRNWLNGEGEKPKVPLLEEFDCFIATHYGSLFVLDKHLEMFQLHTVPAATGSGRDFALMAMRLGKNAIEAVELASEFDLWTGKPVVYQRVKEMR